MSIVGKVDSLWRYPVKSMRGEELSEVFAGFSGVYGDRLFAFHSSTGPKGFPYLTARDQRKMLLYRPRFRHSDKAARPINLAEAEKIGPGVNPVPADTADTIVDVETPTGKTLAIDEPALIQILREGVPNRPDIKLLRSERAMTDCRPISLISVQSVRKLGDELGAFVDPRCFRANIYLDLNTSGGFEEDGFVGRSLRIGSKVVLSIIERDPRCAMITLDPDTGESKPELLKKVAQAHKGMTGIYGAVLREGTVRKGDSVELLS
jgi:uncharacterized protein YcbX